MLQKQLYQLEKLKYALQDLHSEAEHSPLTTPTKKRTPAALHNSLDRGVAAFAGLAFAAVYIKAVLEIAELAVRIRKIPQGAAARFNRLAQHVFNMACQCIRLGDF